MGTLTLLGERENIHHMERCNFAATGCWIVWGMRVMRAMWAIRCPWGLRRLRRFGVHTFIFAATEATREIQFNPGGCTSEVSECSLTASSII